MCRVLGVSRSGYYASRSRPPSEAKTENEKLTTVIRKIHRESRGTYGSPRVHAELRSRGQVVNRKRIARLMSENGIHGQRPRRLRRTTDSEHSLPVAANDLDRRFDVRSPNTVWASDITYVPTLQGWLYLAVVVDLHSRRVVGWSMADHMRTELVEAALSMAIGNRVPPTELVHHSDRGSQYASFRYQKLLESHGMRCSMSRRGNCYDNAVVESFFGTLKTELVHRSTWSTRDEARAAIHDYIELFYNRKRRHSALGYVSPAEYEANCQAAPAA